MKRHSAKQLIFLMLAPNALEPRLQGFWRMKSIFSSCMTRSCLALLLAVLAFPLRALPTPPAVPVSANYSSDLISGSRLVHVHDPSTIIRCGNDYWIFYTGAGIPSYHSRDLVSWQAGQPVFPHAPAWVPDVVPGKRGDFFWAPEVIQRPGGYFLYYAVSLFGKNTSAIALATNVTLDPNDPCYHWTDCGPVVRSVAGDDFNAIDPSLVCTPDKRLWMTFGSFWSGIKLMELNPATGKRKDPQGHVYSLAFNDSIEASYLYPHNGYYYLFVNWGLCCRGTNSTYEVRVGRSRQITGPYLDAGGNDMMEGGGTPFLETQGPFIGPGQVGILASTNQIWLSCHFYDGLHHGRSTLAVFPLEWSSLGWPKVVLPEQQIPPGQVSNSNLLNP